MEEEEEEVYPWIMEEGAEAAEELGVDHLSRSLPLKVGVVQSVVLVQPEEGNYDKKRKRRYLQPKYEPYLSHLCKN